MVGGVHGRGMYGEECVAWRGGGHACQGDA